MVAAECEWFAFWGCTAGVTVWASFKIQSFGTAQFVLKVVANSSEMIWSNPNQLISALSKMVWGCLGWQILKVFSLPEGNHIARLPLRLWPAKMTLVFLPLLTEWRLYRII